ncbi:MAG: 4-hydroxythreonine-4-phosphate dehydrogenase PdxA [Hydrogenophilus sp.]|nr:4-hydroxythreonine-4-phosphate dehydrogenase PdxA [Hydrogenophilus sp.]
MTAGQEEGEVKGWRGWQRGEGGERRPLAVTSGEPAGIGPEICARLGEVAWPRPLVVFGDEGVLRRCGADWPPFVDAERLPPISLAHVPVERPVRPGHLERANARYVLRLLDAAVAGAKAGVFAGVVTAPVHKGVINEAGIPFTGHTEYLAERCGCAQPVMLFVAEDLRVALVTTHLPLSDVPGAITRERLTYVLRVVDAGVRRFYGVVEPTILVAGLNPHAGEGGYLGREEAEVIEPTLAQLRAEGLRLVGPLPADSLFSQRVLAGSSAQVVMYHDQGLPVVKYASFGRAVNVTLGLPFVRTSVDHGTALEIAGRGVADPGSLFAAVLQACAMADRLEEGERRG